MTVKKPNAAQASKILKAAGYTRADKATTGFKVTTEKGGRVDFQLNQSIGARFPVVLVTWNHNQDSATEIIETLTAAGYHAERIDVPTGHMNRVMRAAVVVRSQEELDDRAARQERAANADTEAEKLVPATPVVRIRATTYPDHATRTGTMPRNEAVTLVAASLREPETDVMDADDINSECFQDWNNLFPHRDRIAGFRTRIQGKRATVLLIPVDDSGPAAEPATPAPAANKTPTQEAAEGTVLPAGHTLGILAEHAGDDNARDAAAALTAAGHVPAQLANETDEDDADTAHGTGFLIDVRGERVLVGHLVDGVDMWNSLPDAERRKILRGFRDTLRAAGWETEKSIVGRRMYAWRTSPLPEGVTLPQTRGELPAAEKDNANDAYACRGCSGTCCTGIGSDPCTCEPRRFTVKQLGGTSYGVWDEETDLWVRTGTKEVCQEGADGLNADLLELDAFGRIRNPRRPEDGPYAVFMRPDLGYAPDAHRASLAEAQQTAEDGAASRGLDPKGLGYHWERRDVTKGVSTWTLRSVYHWARPTGISIEGPTPKAHEAGA
ncbi:hypothetical protein [Streptomyces albidoflavus]|uniref:hypothetical protein n=1 Tax=Streptomyces albidoflavus TaxID=1886 RepID=UPI0033F8EA93